MFYPFKGFVFFSLDFCRLLALSLTHSLCAPQKIGSFFCILYKLNLEKYDKFQGINS